MQHYTILMMGYNASAWITKSVESALDQNYPNFDVVAIDAKSNDGTYEKLQAYENLDKFSLYRNTTRQYQSQNMFDGVRYSKDNSIIITLDFDDWLPHQNVLATVDSYYNKDTWLTYGSYKNTSNNISSFGRYTDSEIQRKLFRTNQFRCSHLRTFRKELFLNIQEQDFQDSEGNWIRVAGDCVFMFPMLEMCGEKFKHIPDVLYTYNLNNELSEFRNDVAEINKIVNEIKHKKKYEILETL